ncbi:hypothetical protein LOK49_LG15G02195 [Camellia lanceoleosa]|uniref:Uncharacterized protein n=1 Tax=Camellia lanceoleosa TaxID=1840588 RepID=A0ACC0F482_9ERIC|nr:hypothetical protein LOK49_LG15G02195 [Camellia lanceoleosa]
MQSTTILLIALLRLLPSLNHFRSWLPLLCQAHAWLVYIYTTQREKRGSVQQNKKDKKTREEPLFRVGKEREEGEVSGCWLLNLRMPSSQTIIRILLIGAMHMGGIYVGISVGLEASNYMHYRRERASDFKEYNRQRARPISCDRERDFMDSMQARYYEKKDVGSSSDKSG